MRVVTEKDMSEKQKKPYTPPRVVSYGHVKDVVQGGGGKKNDSAGTPPGGNSRTACWIAEVLYGVDDPRTLILRAWVTRVYDQRAAGWPLVALYRRFGEQAARLIAQGYLPRWMFRVLFDAMLEQALDAVRPLRA